ncbi:protein FAR-RED IMPAIRED RESPONSE 1-like [Vicia villosa]|uniref:protein FAR-RED IMPAIRED RESPONSE 1-like n=1 Tax=Vicia villosa TaxID=3911 RepID=UPI00273A8282|nr:protein FAR-RED IMPAIRED RESPONSE 1-like [Vicia villosa]
MEFESKEDAYSFYACYAKCVGFGVCTKSSRRSKVSKQFIDVKYACTRYGKKRESTAQNPRPCLKVECKAGLHIKIKCDGKWVVHDFIKDHNHDIFATYAHYFPCHRSINKSQKQCIETMQNVGVRTSQIYAAMAKQHGGYEKVGCLEKDIRNHLDKDRRLSLELGDANTMLECFMLMQEENSKFFYAIDLDDDGRLKNVFWVDANGRNDYQDFGDVISFDTTYITNKYKMPFAPFIGVNNHFQSRLLGCALLANESSETFVWLMKTWLRAMGGNPPNKKLLDPKVSKTKGAPRRIKSGIEKGHKKICTGRMKKGFLSSLFNIVSNYYLFVYVKMKPALVEKEAISPLVNNEVCT